MRLYDNDEYRDEFMGLVYSLLHSDGTNDRANQIIDAFDSIPAVEAEPLQPNDPLTLDELREMDGEIVYCVPLNEWIKPTKTGIAFFGTSAQLKWGEIAHKCGKTWLAYRHKPEGV